MRGTLRGLICELPAKRIIPAYAGNAYSAPAGSSQCPDHPRVCGERHISRPQLHAQAGSSPRMRGTRVQPGRAGIHGRIIPAYAGNAGTAARYRRHWADHPRVCGERSPASPCSCSAAGSSPRMRGTPLIESKLAQLRRIIPAYAGNAGSTSGQRTRPADHPRVCGEREGLGLAVHDSPGSSPRMRGTPTPMKQAQFGERIIPAYAGNAFRRCAGWHR